jgi:hypothetical protein
MGTPTYTPLATITLGTTASTVTFSSIPATYRDLVLVINHLPTNSAGAQIQVNNDTTGSNYANVVMEGDGSTTVSYTGTGYMVTPAYGNSTTRQTVIASFMDYSATNKHKTVLTKGGNSAIGTGAAASRWANTAAINLIKIYHGTQQFTAGSTFSLYGIAA